MHHSRPGDPAADEAFADGADPRRPRTVHLRNARPPDRRSRHVSGRPGTHRLRQRALARARRPPRDRRRRKAARTCRLVPRSLPACPRRADATRFATRLAERLDGIADVWHGRRARRRRRLRHSRRRTSGPPRRRRRPPRYGEAVFWHEPGRFVSTSTASTAGSVLRRWRSRSSPGSRPSSPPRRPRHSRSPSRQCGSSGAPRSLRSTEYAGRGARAPNSAVVIRAHAAVEAGLLEDRLGELGPACSRPPPRRGRRRTAARAPSRVACGEVRRRRSGSRAGRRRPRPRRARRRGAASCGRSCCDVQPKSHEERTIHASLAGGGLAVQLRAAVGAERARRVRLDVRLALRAVEDVVGRPDDERRAERGGVLRRRRR